MMVEKSEVKPLIPKQWERAALTGGAVVSFGATFYLALMDKSSAATVMAAVTVAFLAFYFLPFIDSVEAFGLKAKLRAQINEAEDVLANLRKTALVSAKVLYAQLAWQGRMGTPEWATKQVWADEIEANLKGLGVGGPAISDAKIPHLSFAVYDLFLPFNQVVTERVQKLVRENREEREKKFPGAVPAGDQEWTRLVNEGHALSEFLKFRKDLHTSDDLQDFRAVVADRISPLPIPENEKAILLDYGSTFAKIADGIWSQGRVTDEAMDILKRYADHKEWGKDHAKLFSEVET